MGWGCYQCHECASNGDLDDFSINKLVECSVKVAGTSNIIMSLSIIEEEQGICLEFGPFLSRTKEI